MATGTEDTSSLLAIYVAAIAVLLNVVGYFLMAWKQSKDKEDDSHSSKISRIDRKVSSIESMLIERDKRYDERFQRIEKDFSNLKNKV